MKKLLIMCMLLLAVCVSDSGRAQDRITTTSAVSTSTSVEGFARDYVFSLLENYELQGGGKYYQLYVTSAFKTTIHVALGFASDKKFPVNALEVLVFDVPLAWEMTMSGVVEDKAVHVWSTDADLTLNVLSRNPATSDGMTIIPTTAWGREYVVAAFASYAYLAGYELPSEFLIVANQDSTVVTILPSTDLRQGTSTAVAYPRNVAFTVVLDRNQSVQFQASAANGNMDDYDVTGTVISANKAIGVESGVMCANVPAENPYCDHLCQMLLPVDRWGKTFYTLPFINRKGGDGILVIAAQDNTTITRSSSSGSRTHAVLNKFEHYMRHDIDEASKWQSDKPVMLVQYINSTDYPETGSNNGIGDPAMVVIPPTSLYEKNIVWQAPKIRTAETPYRNYVNLIIHKNAVNSTKYDGQSIAGKFLSLDLPGSDYKLYRGTDVKPGSHLLTSDSAAGLYVYGYGSYDAYAWPMRMGGFVRSVTDLLAPELTSQQEECYTEKMLFVDAGAPAIGGLVYNVDSIDNAAIDQVSTSGLTSERLEYRFVVLDSTHRAYADLRVIDAAGNRRRVTHRYTPDLPKMPEGEVAYIQDPDVQKLLALPITSGAPVPLTGVEAKMLVNKQFQIVSAPTSLMSGQTDSIRFYYNQPSIQTFRDTLVVTADCWSHMVPLVGRSSRVNAYGVQDSVLSFNIVVVGNSRIRTTKVFNLGTESFTLDSVVVDTDPDFEFVAQPLPEVVLMNDTTEIGFRFSPASAGQKSAWATVHTSLGTSRIRLAGQGQASGGVAEAEASLIQIFPNPAMDILTVSLNKEQPGSAELLRIIDLAGVERLRMAFPSQNEGSFELDIRQLPGGAYFLELEMASGEVLRQRFTIAR